MKEYYLTIKSRDLKIVNEIMNELSLYDCEMHLDKRNCDTMYNFSFNESSGHRLAESVGRTKYDTSRDMNFYNFVANILEGFGLSREHKGFKYAIECVRLINTYGLGNYTMEKDIYPVVSSWYNTNIRSVEHNIRNAIDFSWKKHEQSNSNSDSEIKMFKSKPSNVKFLNHISKLTFLAYIGEY